MEDDNMTYTATVKTYRDGAYAITDARCGIVVFITKDGDGSGNVSFGERPDMSSSDAMLLLAQLQVVTHRMITQLMKGPIKSYDGEDVPYDR